MEPDFNSDNFGPEMMKWIAKFKVLEAEGITTKRVEHVAEKSQKPRPKSEGIVAISNKGPSAENLELKSGEVPDVTQDAPSV